MSLVASRFNIWTKPIALHTVRVRQRDNWMEWIRHCLLPNAGFMRILVLDMWSSKTWDRVPLPNEELALIQKLLKASEHVAHFAVTWNIWSDLQHECSVLQIESLYLMWDHTLDVPGPSLANLQYPAVLRDLTVYAPPDLENPNPFRRWPEEYLPTTDQCPNIEYITYAVDRLPFPMRFFARRCKWFMFVLLDRTEPYDDEVEDVLEFQESEPNFSLQCIQHWHQILGEWVAKMEGRDSLLIPPETRWPGR
ncbi:hypothetical protein B0H15DRAFT_796293 [Mycena belliarum]|uniref:Uncharacterized protein n=1 Tax=Mycena belliarum TaxID=1033014 RepID=A0AAD6UGL1_9AGAR|nr:hypothetical protein B0H15DRAFT_796293 [Mycena belliae]